MQAIIFKVMPKNHDRRWGPFRRFGKEEHQDCHRQCEKAAELISANASGIILVATGYSPGKESEMAYHLRILKKHGVDCDERVIKIYSGLETIHQMEIAKTVAVTRGAKLVFIVAWVHWLRVKYMAWVCSIKASVIATGGKARPWDVMIEILFILLYPFYLFLPLRKLFKFLARGLRWLKSELHWWLLERYVAFNIRISA